MLVSTITNNDVLTNVTIPYLDNYIKTKLIIVQVFFYGYSRLSVKAFNDNHFKTYRILLVARELAQCKFCDKLSYPKIIKCKLQNSRPCNYQTNRNVGMCRLQLYLINYKKLEAALSYPVFIYHFSIILQTQRIVWVQHAEDSSQNVELYVELFK